MRGRIVFILIAVYVASVHAQWDARSVGQADMLGIAGRKYWVGHGNPAVLGYARHAFLTVSAIPSPFGLPELRRLGALFGTQLESVGLGVEARMYGGSLFRRYDIYSGAALQVEERMYVGFGASLNLWSFASYSGSTSWNVRGGFIRDEQGWSLGAAATFHSGRGVGRSDAADVAAGVTIRPTDGFDISWEVEQPSGSDMLFRCSMQYTLSENVALNLGWSDVVPLLSFGGAFSMAGYECSFGSQKHDVLGWTHAFGLAIQLSGSGEKRYETRD